jgi:hypothetical protein
MRAKDTIRKTLQPLRSWFARDTRSVALLMGRMASWQVRSRTAISSLQDVEFKVSSQWGEDGIIEWLIERASIPPAAQSFIEFGVETYSESNTRFLLQNRNWRGLIMDGSAAVVDAVRADGLAWKHDLTVRPAFITRENINELISSSGFGGEIGLLSVDVDGNDYWIWEAINAVSPIIVVCEYNAVFGDLHPISIPYDPGFSRAKAHHSYLYFGASIAALRSLATRKGYRFVGTNSAGNDAFFVREDYAKPFVDSSLRSIRAVPSKFRESRDEPGKLNYISALDRVRHIAGMPVVNVEAGETFKLGDLGQVYSREWILAMTGTLLETKVDSIRSAA